METSDEFDGAPIDNKTCVILSEDVVKSESDHLISEDIYVDGEGKCMVRPETDGVFGADAAIRAISSKFEVDVKQIETASLADQAAEIESLGLTVYDQSTLERGIWDQVEKETRRKETQEELANVSSKLKLAEELLKRVESSKSVKRSLLQSALEGPSKKRPDTGVLKSHKETTEKQLKELRLKQAELQEQLSSRKKVVTKADASKGESERERKIRMGEMTPFGTTLSAPSSDLRSFEKYLKSQQELHKKMISGNTGKKTGNNSLLSQKSKQTSGIQKTSSLNSIKSSNKTILKQRILFPKKCKGKEKLGTDTSSLKEDQQRSSGGTAAESSVIDFEDSGSEYVPSDSNDDVDFHPERKNKKTSQIHQSKSKGNSLPPNKKTDRWAGGTLKRRRKNDNSLMEDDQEDWKSDDSDWLCTDDEYLSSDNDSGRKVKRASKKAIDDGNDEDFYRRVKHWEKQNEGLREQMEEDVHEFENGFKVPNLIWDKLYIYQQVGVRWMWELNQQRCGGILGDEMGLGKTIQVIAFLSGLSISKLKCRTTGYRGLGPCLIVCPTTVMHQWAREFHTWFPPLRVAILHESGAFVGRRSQLVRDMLHAKGVIITSYTAVVRLKDHLLHQRFHYIILDEGHKIRNPDAQVTLAVKQLRTPHRLILSGSPLQNNLRELWSLMDFVFPGKLGTLPVFMSEFAVPISQGGYSNASEVMVATAFKCATVLRDTIGPYLLRRMKADVSDHIKLPAKNEQVLFCRLTDEQRDLYKGYLQCGEVGRILEGRCQIFVGLINLRKICNHPHLYSGGPKLFVHEREEDIPEEERFGYWEKAGKMVVIKALLKMWRKQEHRVLIFTQGRQMLLILEKFVSDQGYRYLKLDGGTSIAARQPLINKFNEDKSYFLMLLTTKVGGLGVNLTGANRVVIYDPDWNPATDTQARERAWRIGQQKTVTVYRLITAGTIEEKMYHRQIFKQFLCNKVLKDPRQRRFFKSNDLLELFTLKETDDNNTETAAIFAGTNSQVHLKPKHKSQRHAKDRKHLRKEVHSKCYSDRNSVRKHRESKDTTKIIFSQDKLDAMRKFAHELSLELSKKVNSASRETNELVEEALKSENVSESSDICRNSEGASKLQEIKVQSKQEGDDLVMSVEMIREQENSSVFSATCCEVTPVSEDQDQNELSNSKEWSAIIQDDFDEDLEDMKQLAKELSKELSEKVQAAASMNKPNMCGINTINELNQNQPQDSCLAFEKDVSEISVSYKNENLSVPSEENPKSNDYQDDKFVLCPSGSTDLRVDEQVSADCGSPTSSSLKINHESRKSDEPKEIAELANFSSLKPKKSKKHKKHKNQDAAFEEERECSFVKSDKSKRTVELENFSSKQKASKKHKKHKNRDAVFEGERVRGLIKASTLESKIKTEMAEEASHSSKQDDYVLRKLFAKTGIKTAMQHDKVMESGHADYALVEGEARRVAQEAVKAMKASRQHCWTPMSGQPTWTGASGTLRVSQEAENRSQLSRPKFGKKKHSLRKVGKDPGAAAEGGSSSLLAKIRERNLLLTEEDEDERTITGAPLSVPDSNQELLADIKTFISFGASVEGRATTDEIVSQFRDRLPPQTSALFKQMLMQICEFHRLPSGQGIWKLTTDFQW